MNRAETTQKTTALCPCQSGENYADCCAPLHLGARDAENAERLMRSRYAAFVRRDIDYIVRTTVPSQQPLLDTAALRRWAENTRWLGLQIIDCQPHLSARHSAVEFHAVFAAGQARQVHHEKSLFVRIGGRWYFADPTVALPAMKQPCICGSGKKFKHCCGELLCRFYSNV